MFASEEPRCAVVVHNPMGRFHGTFDLDSSTPLDFHRKSKFLCKPIAMGGSRQQLTCGKQTFYASARPLLMSGTILAEK
jgi:hypothetical protein